MGAAHTRPFLKKGDKNFSEGFLNKVLINFFQKIAGSKGSALCCRPQTAKSKHSKSIFLWYFLFTIEKESTVFIIQKFNFPYYIKKSPIIGA
ncbi:MAG: hypothetical protein H7Y41_05995 [Hyphomonadaceae bacterium]|nr:hypothetical protein [Clostridia bacterium]